MNESKEEKIKELEYKEHVENRVVLISVTLFIVFMLICMGIVEATKSIIL